MFSRGDSASATPMSLAVSGISCIRPMAPFFDLARGRNADSAWITARTSAGSIPYLLVAARISSLKAFNCSGTLCQSTLDRGLQA